MHESHFRAWSVTANIQTLAGTGEDKVPGWWHPGETKGHDCYRENRPILLNTAPCSLMLVLQESTHPSLIQLVLCLEMNSYPKD